MEEIQSNIEVEPTRKIKLVLSDLHIGKGRRLPEGGFNNYEEFFYEKKLMEFFNYYSTGEYRDYDVEIILNGDILNFLQVDYKGHFLTVITEGIALDILRSIVEGHKALFQALRDFLKTPNHSVTYVVGNHDQHMLWPALRDYLDEVLGASVKYKNIVYYFDGVHIEHGHMHEAANRLNPKKFFLKKDLPEPILNLPFGSHFFVDFVMKIKESYPHVDKIRPFSNMIRWTLFNKFFFTVGGLAKLLLYFAKAVIVKDARRNWTFGKVAKVFLESAVFPDLSESAKRILSDDRIHTVIFGHTHVYEYRQWGPDKEYFNSGTWTELTSLDVKSLGKITKLTYIAIEYPIGEDRPRGRLKEWRGYHRIEEDVVIS